MHPCCAPTPQPEVHRFFSYGSHTRCPSAIKPLLPAGRPRLVAQSACFDHSPFRGIQPHHERHGVLQPRIRSVEVATVAKDVRARQRDSSLRVERTSNAKNQNPPRERQFAEPGEVHASAEEAPETMGIFFSPRRGSWFSIAALVNYQ
ncbi:hypothetical protein PPTG_22110 [Phytophthora nicotianae INRA-310]|uniref:Uncharacterized protein n=1 Tax=Phytophthora nicotianae (strain INRA-310) TaxID=761204 RepID=W2QQ72_PHYN3|nr:hypothetical protein PPTG_22110 [Phytophthora nicotianae INRA-310]ETN14390.1 hypothetical protein PPTG_22110 [Phytophthora nicotianae INRA-310]